MTGGRDHDQLERELSEHLAEAAATPRAGAAARIRARMATTPQRRAWLVRLRDATRSPGWARAGALVAVAAAALVLGIYIGQVGLPIQIGPSPSGSQSPNDGPAEIRWQEPQAYSFVLEGCGPNDPIGTLRVWVVDGVSVDFEALDEHAEQYEEAWTPDLMPTIGWMVEQANDALSRTEPAGSVVSPRPLRSMSLPVVAFELDAIDGHPTHISIDWSPEGIDDELCWSILEFKLRPTATPGPTPAPGVAMSYALWERFDMPDPAPGVYGGGTPRALVRFDGGYVAVGTRINNCCAGEPSENDGVVWTSTDGRSWQLADTGATFVHASLHQVVVAGSRLLATGWHAEPGDERQAPAAWSSADGVAWERIPDPAPSWVVVADGILLGAADVTSSGGPPVQFLRSDDGLAWRVTDVQPEMDWVSAVAAAPGGGAIFVGRVEGARRPDGSPTADVQVWLTADGITWTGAFAAQNAVFKSVAPWGDGFVAVGSQPRVVEGTEITAGVIWTSPDGLSWEARGTGTGLEESTLTGVFRVGEALVAVAECCGGDMVLRPTAWISEDGMEWTSVPHQPGFAGSGIIVAGIVESDLGLVGIGQRWDNESNHPLPQAWSASSEPMVWLQPSSQGGALVGETLPFTMGHCGLTSPLDFDGSLWAPEGYRLTLPFDMTTGTITLVEPNRAQFVSDDGELEVFLVRLEGAAPYRLCD